jgi:excisionase family DNA binding protein
MAREYYSIPEAAAILGISRIAVFKKVKKGQLEALRFGRNWAVPAHALSASPSPAPLPRPVPAPKKKEAEARPPLPSDSELDSMGWD